LEIVDFNCSLFVPGEIRRRHFVSRLGKGEDKQSYFLPNADSVKQLHLRAEQVDGQRVLNFLWKAEE
jgi:hypothetical protein